MERRGLGEEKRRKGHIMHRYEISYDECDHHVYLSCINTLKKKMKQIQW